MAVNTYPPAASLTYGAVTSQTAFGAASANGSATSVSRSDHTHGTPSLTSNTASTQEVGDAAAVGTGTAPARDDHKHAMPAFGAVTSQTAYGAASANGSATTIARSDHTHGTPALTANAATTQAIGDAAAVGTGTAPARDDHKHAMPAFGAVTSQTAFGAASANGSAATVARSDHTHGTPAAPTATSVGAPTTAQYDESRLIQIMTAGTPCPSIRRSSPLTITTSNQALLTVAAGRKYVIKSVILTNGSTSDVTVNFSVSGTVLLGTNVSVKANSALVLDMALVMTAGEILNIQASSSSLAYATAVYADLASTESPTRYATNNAALTANTWTTLFTAAADLVITSVTADNTSSTTASKFAIRVGTGVSVLDATSAPVGGMYILDSPIYVPSGAVFQAWDSVGGIVAFTASGYPAAS